MTAWEKVSGEAHGVASKAGQGCSGLPHPAHMMHHVGQFSDSAANRGYLASKCLCAAALVTLGLACRQQKGSAAVPPDVMSPSCNMKVLHVQ